MVSKVGLNYKTPLGWSKDTEMAVFRFNASGFFLKLIHCEFSQVCLERNKNTL